jgi:V/A-type H+-transporting ATPase subunit C
MDALTQLMELAGMPTNIFMTLLVLAGIAIFLVIMIFLIRYLAETAPFAYVNARVRSMESRLLKDHKMNELIEAAGANELIGFLEDTDYGPYLSEVLGQSEDPTVAEKALDTHLAHVYKTLANISPDSARKILKLLEKKFDVKNIKTLLRAKYVGLNAEETFKLLIPLGTIPESRLRELSETKSVEEIVNALEGTGYTTILSDALTDYEQTGKLTALEMSLDKSILESLWKNVSVDGTEKDLFKEFIGAMIDIENLKIILKGKADGLSSEVISNYTTSKGYELAAWKLKELADVESIEGVISSLEGTKYTSIMNESLEEFEKVKSVYIFEKALDKYLVNMGKKLSLRQPFGIGPIIGLITSKELEIRNLKIIIKGKIEGLSASEI